ncbi:MAG TPA: hypothetical protein VKC35_13420, partial [Vicinamibacterales bacterium]|nr:hypothetical protein [Vicinamibacterales bacterium]
HTFLQFDGQTVASIQRITSGHDAWIEVLARDPAIARDFYGQLFGWSARDTSFEPFAVYTVFERPGNQEGGLLPIQPEWEIEPMWNTIVSVDDCDATMNGAPGLGGHMGFVHTVPQHGRVGSIFDPGGAFLALRGPVPAATA